MSAEFTYLVQLYGCAVSGREAPPPTGETDWKKLLALANEQAITGTVSLVLKKAPFCPQAIREECTGLSVGAALKNGKKTEAILNTVDALQAAGFHPVIVKGYDIARFYAHPECRSSADSDILIPPQEEQPVLAMLADMGCDVTPRKKGGHHAEAIHPQGGLMEIHVQLYDDDATVGLLGDDGARNAAPTTYTQADFAGRTIPVLLPEDAIQFLTVHTVKHFVGSGIILRQAFDHALYFARCADGIDTDAYWERMKRYGFYDFMQRLLWAFVQCGCFPAEAFPGLIPQPAEDCEALLSDIEQVPAYGQQNLSTWEYFYYWHSDNGGERVQEAKRKRRRKTMLTILLPPMKRLIEEFPYLNGRPWLYPVAWVHRLIRAFSDRDRRRGLSTTVNMTNADAIPTGEDDPVAQRIRLLRQNGLMG